MVVRVSLKAKESQYGKIHAASGGCGAASWGVLKFAAALRIRTSGTSGKWPHEYLRREFAHIENSFNASINPNNQHQYNIVINIDHDCIIMHTVQYITYLTHSYLLSSAIIT